MLSLKQKLAKNGCAPRGKTNSIKSFRKTYWRKCLGFRSKQRVLGASLVAQLVKNQPTMQEI